MIIDREPVVSSNLKSVGYDEDSETLEIEFQSDSVYRYFGVPADIYQELMDAPSHGSDHWHFIRDDYEYVRMN